MEVNDKPATPPSPWSPERDGVRLAVLGKLLEELGEAASAAARCIIQGIDELDPETGKPNSKWLAEEIADVRAMSDFAVEHFGLGEEFIRVRTERKKAHKRKWYAMIERDGL